MPSLIPHYVYRLYGDDGQLWYIGFTRNVTERLANHRSSRKPWAKYGSYRTTPYASYDEALAGERQAIHDENPLFNGTRPKPRPAPRQQSLTRAEKDRLEAAAEREVADWPPLSQAQRDRLALLLSPGGTLDHG